LVEIAFIAPTQDVNAWSLMTGASTMAGRSLRDGYSNGKIIQLNVFFLIIMFDGYIVGF